MWFNLKNEKQVRLAKALCKGCPERITCLEDCLEYEALSWEDRHGIFGGLTPNERRKLQTRTPR
jgi:hypothetical protein